MAILLWRLTFPGLFEGLCAALGLRPLSLGLSQKLLTHEIGCYGVALCWANDGVHVWGRRLREEGVRGWHLPLRWFVASNIFAIPQRDHLSLVKPTLPLHPHTPPLEEFGGIIWLERISTMPGILDQDSSNPPEALGRVREA